MIHFGQNWPKFGLNLGIAGHNSLEEQVFKKNLVLILIFWSLDQLVVETFGVASVRACVRTSATLFLGNRSLLFSETLQLVRACKRKKHVTSAFWIIFTVLAILAKNWSKLAVWLDVCNSILKGWKSLRNLKVGVFETDFKQVPFVFRQTTCTYSQSWLRSPKPFSGLPTNGPLRP